MPSSVIGEGFGARTRSTRGTRVLSAALSACMQSRSVAIAFLGLCLFSGQAAFADQAPALPNVPPSIRDNPYVQSMIDAVSGILQTTRGNQAQGHVAYFKGYDLQLETAPHVFRQVRLHRGTIINPRGGTLVPGMNVEIVGVPQEDGSLGADVITIL